MRPTPRGRNNAAIILDRKIARAESERALDRARAAFRRLAEDETLPLVEIVDQALMHVVVTDADRTVSFLDRLATIVDANARE